MSQDWKRWAMNTLWWSLLFASCYEIASSGHVAAQAPTPPGLKVHRRLVDGVPVALAVCDEATGTMLYIAHRMNAVSIATLPGGCRGGR